jgi:SOS-response transcriptional repressor LexA
MKSDYKANKTNALLNSFKREVGLKLNKDVADALNISQANLSNRIKRGTLEKLFVKYAEENGIDPEKFTFDRVSISEPKPVRYEIETAKLSGHEQIPMIRTKLSENGGIIHSEETANYYSFRKDWAATVLTSENNAYLLTVTGNSMEPTLYNRDVVLLDTGRTHIYDGELFAIQLDDTIMIKRLFLKPGERVRIVSDNKEHHSYETERRKVTVLAQVVWFARTLTPTTHP